MQSDEPRGAELEAAVAASPNDPEPCLVYADWLDARGRPRMAAGYRLLAGAVDGDPQPMQLELGLVAVSAEIWLQPPASGWLDDEEQYMALVARLEALRHRRAAVEAGRWRLPGDDTSLAEAVRAARRNTPAGPFHRLLAGVIRDVDASGRTPLGADESLARSLATMDEDAFVLELPAEGYGAFSFERVQLTNASRGVDGLCWWRAPDGDAADDARALCALAATFEFGSRELYSARSPEQRLRWFQDDFLGTQSAGWTPQSHYDFLEWAFQWLTANEGHDPVVGEAERPLLDALDTLGSYRAGVTTGEEFAVHGFVFDRAFVVSKVSW